MTNREEIERRRTFAIISHPDAGKTTLTEKLLLYGGAINQAGSVKGKQSAKHAVSDWMDIEKQRGISPKDVSKLQEELEDMGEDEDLSYEYVEDDEDVEDLEDFEYEEEDWEDDKQ